ncbi:MAG TPA: DEAD/DEAH box helicase [Nocardioidaceae bacterium]|nr:DEAD/DEAH box helicase [Nocardioidaceae bacterium]
MSTPAQQYARFRANQKVPALTEFRGLYDFELDDFQSQACIALENGDGVLVAAPTGSGKTIVGEFAVHLALRTGRKCFYTTPIKALSNQKFHDLVRRYGPEQVGLLTGDNTINGEAPVVVMTTEVLRNMLYAGSSTLAGLGYVVMDEVHYLADRFRGAVWEEVIIHLPESVAVVSLSATVSNAEEFGDWLSTVRGATTTIVEERRPVPLFQHVMVGRRMYDLFADDGTPEAGPRVNTQLLHVARDDWRARRTNDYRGRRNGQNRHGGRQGGRQGPGQAKPGYQRRSRAFTPQRVDVVDRLDADGLLPAIVFIFSRAGCDAAVVQCLHGNLRLTSQDERAEIRRYVTSRTSDLPEEDLHVLGFHDWADGLERGVASHHAGLLPTFKEIVETLFSRGLLKVVFATETLALGINMPARSVVLEKLTKWNGETHADVTPGEYTQLTGRAGRRGIDVEGHAVVLWQPGLEPGSVAGLASTRTYPLRSSFKPSYNMAVNLVRQVGRARSRELLESSFAQFQADKAVVGLARQLRKSEDALDGYREAATCHLGDFMEYADLRRRLTDRERTLSKRRKADRREDAARSLEDLRIGDVIAVPAGKWAGLAVVLDPGFGSERDGPRPFVLTADRQARRLSPVDFPAPVEALTRMRVPRNFNARNPAQRRDLASTLRNKAGHIDVRPPRRNDRGPAGIAEDPEVARLRTQLRGHPCHGCDEREDHARWAERYVKLEREAHSLQRRIEQRTNTIARQFDRVCEVLGALGYLDGDRVTTDGERLMRVYTEMDLVAAECLRRRIWEGLDPAELAAALSALVFEARRPDDAGPPRMPVGPIREALGETVAIWADLDALEREHRVDFLREPDLGFAWAAFRWANGASLDEVLAETDLAAGDFVRWIKQLLDLTDQIADAAGNSPLRQAARHTAGALRRGVVAYSSVAS